MRTFVSSLKPDGSFIGRLDSLVHASAWDISDAGEVENSRWVQVHIPRVIPILPGIEDAPVHWAVRQYREQMKDTISQRMQKTRQQLKKIRSGEKRYMAQREVDLAQRFLDTANAQIVIVNEDQEKNIPFRHMRTPPFSGIEKFLPKSFLTRYGYSSHLRTQQYHFLDGNNISSEMVPIEILERGRLYAVDLETHNWKTLRLGEKLRAESIETLRHMLDIETKKTNQPIDENILQTLTSDECIRRLEHIANAHRDERITVGSYISIEHQNYLVTTFPFRGTNLEVTVPGSDKTVRVEVIVVPNQQEITRTLSELCDMTDPLYMAGHNHLKFDYRKANELSDSFNPGINGEKPVHASQAGNGFVVRTEIPGRESIDPGGYSQHYMHNRNNKLDTVLEDVTGVVEAKDMTHDELFERTARAEEGSVEDIELILTYAAKDSMKSVLIARGLLREHLLLGRVSQSSLARIDTTSKKTVASEYHDSRRIFFGRKRERSGIDRAQSNEVPFHEFDIVDQFFALPNGWRSAHGLIEGRMIAFFPYARAFEPLLSQDPNIAALYQEVRNAEPKKKVRLLRAITAFAEYPLFRMLDEQNVTPTQFEKEFGLMPGGRDAYAARNHKSMEAIREFFMENSLINYNRDLFLIDGTVQPKNIPGGVDLGKGIFFSGEVGCFGGMIDDQTILRGVADPKSKKGERCRFERTFTEQFILRLIKGDTAGALAYAAQQIQQLHQKEVHPNELGFSRTATRNYSQYSARATGQSIERLIEAQVQTGDVVEYTYPTEQLMVKFFGAPQNRHWGTLSRLIHWAFPLAKHDGRAPMFQAMYEGRERGFSIDDMIDPAEKQKRLF